MEMLEQFRRDVNDAHAHAYDENNRYVQGSSGGIESTESTSQDEENDTEKHMQEAAVKYFKSTTLNLVQGLENKSSEGFRQSPQHEFRRFPCGNHLCPKLAHHALLKGT